MLRRALVGSPWLVLACSVACGARSGLLAYGTVEDDDDVDAASGVPRFAAASADGSSSELVACVPGVLELSAATPTVLFAIDRSLSMAQGLAGGAGSRWDALRAGLENTLPEVDARMQIGSLLFPSSGGDGRRDRSCEVNDGTLLLPARNQADAVLRGIAGAAPGGSTPTADAVRFAANALLSVRAAKSARALVLATDGAPACDAALDPATCECVGGRRCSDALRCLDDERTVTVLADVAAHGVPTYVVGLLADDNTQRFARVLDQMARAGGRPQTGTHAFYPATDERELEAAFTSIRDQVGACVYLTTSVPDLGGSIELRAGDEVIPYDVGGSTGWSWADRDNGEISLSPDVCERAHGVAILASVTCHDGT